MEYHVTIGKCELYHGDCWDVLGVLPDSSVDLILGDAPWKPRKLRWHVGNPQQAILHECLRVARGPVIWVGGGTPDGNAHFGMFKPPAQWVDIDSSELTRGLEAHGVVYAFRPLWGWRLETAIPFTPQVNESLLTPGYQLGPHTSPTPVELARQIILGCGARSVLDPFMGTGWTGVACALCSIPFIGIEIKHDTFVIAAERIRWAYRETTTNLGWNEAGSRE